MFGLDLPLRGIRATNTRGCLDIPIAEWNIAMMVNLLRDFRQMNRNQDAAVWDSSATFQRELRGATVGLWGYGGIGRETSRLAKQMGLRVHVMARKGVEPIQSIYTMAGTAMQKAYCPIAFSRRAKNWNFCATWIFSSLHFRLLKLPKVRLANVSCKRCRVTRLS